MGFDVFRPTGEGTRAFAVLGSPTDAWPAAEPQAARPADLTWRGYVLDRRRFPTFLYDWKRLKVTDHFEVENTNGSEGGTLVRTIQVEGAIPPHAYFRAAADRSIVPVEGGFLVGGSQFSLEGRKFENQFRIAAEGAVIAGSSLLIPVRDKLQITYSLPSSHALHAH
jgi:hypothetical protein